MRSTRCFLVFALVLVRQKLPGQAPVVTLKPPQLRHDSAFAGLRSARILSDDRVLVAEFDTRRLLILDFRSIAVRQIGRRGQGPGEYATTPMLFALGGDSTLAAVRSQRRWLVLSADTIVATVPPTDSLLVKTRGSIAGANRTHFLFTRDRPPRADGIVDSADVFQIARASGRVEPIARIRTAATRIGGSKDSQGRTVETSDAVGVIRSSENALLFDDGWVAIVRLEPAKVEWRQPGGQWLGVASLGLRPVRFDARQKAWYLRENQLSAESVVWPSVMPLLRGSAFAAPDGRVIAERSRDADAGYPRYLLIDRHGKAEGEIRLRAGQRILAVSAKWILLLSADDDGLQHLALHPWP